MVVTVCLLFSLLCAVLFVPSPMPSDCQGFVSRYTVRTFSRASLQSVLLVRSIPLLQATARRDPADSACNTVKVTDGGVYAGEWKAGKREGRGRHTGADGDVYEGALKDGMAHGKGHHTSATGDVYEGEYMRGKQKERGKQTEAATGNVYDGNWKDGKMNGRGKYTVAALEMCTRAHGRRGTGRGLSKLRLPVVVSKRRSAKRA